ncbi:MAG TPA: ribosome maturation factor RimM [Jatrophihabitans sp.]|nr:ribosome maturation factor RimM [Jatrophihabitans sp.]
MTGDPDPTDEVLAVGRVGRAHGVRGDVFVEPWTDAPEERFADGAVVYAGEQERRPLTVAGARSHSGKLVLHFAGLDDRSAVEAIRGAVLVVPATDRPPLTDPDEFYDSDLVGLSVSTVGGTPLGPVTEVLHSPAGSLLVIDWDGRELLVPFRREVVPTVDLARRVAVIDPPEGLLDL